MVKLEISRTIVFSAPRRPVEMVMRLDECLRKLGLHQAEADEQASEQQDFGNQEQPHPDLAGIELLLLRGEMMLQSRIVVAVMAVRVPLVLIRRLCFTATH